MGYAMVRSVALNGIGGQLVVVEADVTDGLPHLVLTGLPDTALAESRDRVRAALHNTGARWPQQRITVNLLPAHVPKHGSGFDLPIAVALLAAAGQIKPDRLQDTVLLGELGLDGTLRPIRGVLPAVLTADRAGIRRAVVPVANVAEARLVPGMTVWAAATLRQLLEFVRGAGRLDDPPDPPVPALPPGPDLADVVGQERGRRAVELAAAGGHHLALFGPPGAGKTMLAERLPGILPALTDRAALQTTALHSLAGVLPLGGALLRRPPFQAPHHSSSVAALVGGGSGLARPGAVSLAHHGVLLLDECPEFSPSVLNALRQPLEDGTVRLRRAAGETTYPARAQLVIAANPCPCARPAGDRHCQCTALARRRYQNRISGPLLDRVDLQVDLLPVSAMALLDETIGESSESVAARVLDARGAATARWQATNAAVPGILLRRPPYRLPRTVMRPATEAVEHGHLSARGFDRTLRVAWSIADLDGRLHPTFGDVTEAIQLRTRRWS